MSRGKTVLAALLWFCLLTLPLAAQSNEGWFDDVSLAVAWGVSPETRVPDWIPARLAWTEVPRRRAYVTALHTLILLLDRSMPRAAKRGKGGTPTPSLR